MASVARSSRGARQKPSGRIDGPEPGRGRQVHLVPPGASILVKSGFYEGLEVCVDRDWLVIGRGRSADVVLAEPTISRSHAAIGFDGEGFFVQDLGSTNGTLVNGAKTKRAPLKNCDVVQMGKLIIGVTLPT
jgi:pSer/pThr/pTyr-binding forkhead associated (FHA) protein